MVKPLDAQVCPETSDEYVNYSNIGDCYSCKYDTAKIKCLTWVKRFHITVEKTDIHPPHVDNVEQGCNNHAPHTQEHSNQNIDWKHEVSQQEQIHPANGKY